jgi:uncharacterized protein YaaQ
LTVKLLISIVHRDDADAVIDALMRERFRATHLSTSGGFLQEGNATILIGIEADQVSQVLDIIKANTKEHTSRVPTLFKWLSSRPQTVRIGAATVFMLDLGEITRF